MSEGQSAAYKLEHTPAAKQQIHSIAATAKQMGQLEPFISILKQAVQRMQIDPHGWGDPGLAPNRLCSGMCLVFVWDERP